MNAQLMHLAVNELPLQTQSPEKIALSVLGKMDAALTFSDAAKPVAKFLTKISRMDDIGKDWQRNRVNLL